MFLRTAHRQPTIANGESPSQAFANNGATTSLKLNRKSKEPKGFLKVPTNAPGNRGMASATSGMAKGPDATTLLSPPPATQHRRRSVLRPRIHRVPPSAPAPLSIHHRALSPIAPPATPPKQKAGGAACSAAPPAAVAFAKAPKRYSLFGHNVYQAAGHHDNLLQVLALHGGLHGFKRHGLHVVLGSIGRNGDACAFTLPLTCTASSTSSSLAFSESNSGHSSVWMESS